MSGFTSPIVGGQGTILIPAIQSPNFNLGAQTGWSIQKNGNAYFFNITATGTITATSFAGTDFNINTSGEFFYSAAPAHGNLTMSLASVSGTDAFSNSYVSGITVYGPSGSLVNISVTGGLGIFMRGASATHITSNAQLSASMLFPGGSGETQILNLSSGTESGMPDASLLLSSTSPDGATSLAQATFQFGGNPFCYITQTGIILPGNPTPSVFGQGAAIFASTSGTLQVVDGVDSQVYGTERRTIVTGGNQSITSTSFGTVLQSQIQGTTTGTRVYRVHAHVIINPNQAAGQMLFAYGISSFTAARISVQSWAIGEALNNQTPLAPNTSYNLAFVMSNGQQYTLILDGTITMATNSGSIFSLQFAEQTAGDAFTVLGGSYLEIMPV